MMRRKLDPRWPSQTRRHNYRRLCPKSFTNAKCKSVNILMISLEIAVCRTLIAGLMLSSCLTRNLTYIRNISLVTFVILCYWSLGLWCLTNYPDVQLTHSQVEWVKSKWTLYDVKNKSSLRASSFISSPFISSLFYKFSFKFCTKKHFTTLAKKRNLNGQNFISSRFRNH